MYFQRSRAVECSSDTTTGGHWNTPFHGGAGDEQFLGYVDPTKSIGFQYDDRMASDGLMANGEDGAVNRGPPLPSCSYLSSPECRQSVMDGPDCMGMIADSYHDGGAMDAVSCPDHGGCWSGFGKTSMALSSIRGEGVLHGAVQDVSSQPPWGGLDTTYMASPSIRNEVLETIEAEWDPLSAQDAGYPDRSGSNTVCFDDLSDSELSDHLFGDSPCDGAPDPAPAVPDCGDAEDMGVSGADVLEGVLKPMGFGLTEFQFQEVNPHVQEPRMEEVEWDHPISKHSKEVKADELCERLGAHPHPPYEYFLVWKTGKGIVCDEPREAQPPYKQPRPNTNLATGVRIKLMLTIVFAGPETSRWQDVQLCENIDGHRHPFRSVRAERGTHCTVTFEVDNKSFLKEHPNAEDRYRRIVLLDRGELVREYHFRAYESNGSVPQRIQPQKRRRRICAVRYSTRPKRSRDEADFEPEGIYNKRQCIGKRTVALLPHPW